jgi:hypothetical protein
VREELWVCKRLSALLLQTGHREALLPDRALLSTAVCLCETRLLQPLLRGSQVLCAGSGRVLRSGSVCGGSPLLPGSGGLELLPRSGRCSGLLCSGSRRVALLPGSGCRSGLLCAGSGRFALLPRSGDLRLPGSVCRSSVLRSSEVLPGSGDVWLPGSVCRSSLL